MRNIEAEDLRWWRENYLSALTSPRERGTASPAATHAAAEAGSGPARQRFPEA